MTDILPIEAELSIENSSSHFHMLHLSWGGSSRLWLLGERMPYTNAVFDVADDGIGPTTARARQMPAS